MYVDSGGWLYVNTERVRVLTGQFEVFDGVPRGCGQSRPASQGGRWKRQLYSGKGSIDQVHTVVVSLLRSIGIEGSAQRFLIKI